MTTIAPAPVEDVHMLATTPECVPPGKGHPGYTAIVYHTLCGEKNWTAITDFQNRVTCPACRKLLGLP